MLSSEAIELTETEEEVLMLKRRLLELDELELEDEE